MLGNWRCVACFFFGLAGCQSADDPRSAAMDADLQALQGRWVMVSSVCCGEEMPSEMVRQFSRVIEGEVSTLTIQEEHGPKIITGTLRVDSQARPKTIDITLTSGESRGKTVLGIYVFEADRFKMCYAGVGKPRPMEFMSTPCSDQYLVVWKRVEKP